MNNKPVNKYEVIELLQARMVEYHHRIDELMDNISDTPSDTEHENLSMADAVLTELNALVEHFELHM